MDPKRENVLKEGTLLGYDWDQVLKALAHPLPPNCYKAITGGSGGAAGLTDIKPQALITVLTCLFGPCGRGWDIEYDPNRLIMDPDTNATWSTEITFWYMVVDENGERTAVRIQTPAYNRNPDMGWSAKGMITTAIKNAAFRLGWQGLVQMGSLSHKNAVDVYEEAGPHPFEREILTAMRLDEDVLTINDVKREWAKAAKAVGLFSDEKHPTGEEVENFKKHLGTLFTDLQAAQAEQLADLLDKGLDRINEWEG
jgi:hypothetical protein